MATDPGNLIGNLIGDQFEVEPGRPLAGAGGGLAACVASDRRNRGERLMAVRVPDLETPRPGPLAALVKAAVPSCLGPLAHGLARDDRGRTAQFVICPAPPGRSLAEATGLAAGQDARPWSEAELVDMLLRPAATALAALDARHVTHRAIRLDNVFQPARGQPVTLGCAWASAAASRQPDACEPAYSLVCGPNARGDGVIADDVYALGVLMVTLASGVQPLAGLDRDAVVARKLDLGSAAAILGEQRLPPMIADLARGMLADDPEHRPSPAMLLDLEVARARRVAARPRRRAQRSIEVGGQTAWTARDLAHVLACQPVQSIRVLRDGAADHWLRRGLGDFTLALSLEEAVRQRAAETGLADADADAVLLMRAVAALDPLAPLCWRGLRLWPVAIGPALAAAAPEQEAALVRMIDAQAMAVWALARAQRCDPASLQTEARQLRALLRQRGWTGGVARVRYATNPLLRCRSLVLEPAVAVRPADVLPALEQAAGRADRPVLPMDAELAAFLAARLEPRREAELMGIDRGTAPQVALAQLRVLSRLHAKQSTLLLPRLAAWLGASCALALATGRSRSRQAAARAALDAQVAAGRLTGMLAVLDNRVTDEADRNEKASAAVAMANLDARIAAALRQLEAGRLNAPRLGREIAASAGIVAAVAAAIMAAL